MTGTVWVVVIPFVVGCAAVLWMLSRKIPGWGMILVGVAIYALGKLLMPAFPAVEDGYTGRRFGSLLQRTMPDVVFLLQILGTVAVVHGIVIWVKRGKKGSQPAAP